MNIELTNGEILNPNKKEEFRFSLDIFNDNDKWRRANNHFEYIGDIVGARVWMFLGTQIELENKLSEVGIKLRGNGYRSNLDWGEGNWIFIFLDKTLDF